MSDDKAGEARQGFVSSVKGKAKEVAGAVTGNDSLTAEGQLQQSEAKARREANTGEAVANAERSEAAEALREEERAAAQQRARVTADADYARADSSARTAEQAAQRARDDARQLNDDAGLS